MDMAAKDTQAAYDIAKAAESAAWKAVAKAKSVARQAWKAVTVAEAAARKAWRVAREAEAENCKQHKTSPPSRG